MTRYVFYFIILLLYAGCTVSYLDSGYLIPSVNDPVSLDFTMQEDLILIEAEVNGIKGEFLLDNGFSMSAVDPEFAEKANIRFKGEATLRDANNAKLEIGKALVDTVRIQGQTFVNTGFYEIETSRFFPCYPVDGIIGASIINKINWEIDFSGQKIRLSSRPFDRPGTKIKVDFINNNSSLLDLTVHGQAVRAKIDLGSSGGIKLDAARYRAAFAGSEVIKRTGMFSLSAAGLGAVDTSYQTVESLPVNYGGQPLSNATRIGLNNGLKYQGYVGLEYFRGYHLIINSTEREYILSDGGMPEQPDELSYGLAIYLVEGSWKIIQMNPNDPLLQAVPLLSEVESVDGAPISRFPDICAYKAYLKEKIEQEETLRIGLKDSGELIELPYRRRVSITLK